MLTGLDGARDSETSGEAFGPGSAFLGRVREGEKRDNDIFVYFPTSDT